MNELPEEVLQELDTMRATLDEAALRFFLDAVPPVSAALCNEPLTPQ